MLRAAAVGSMVVAGMLNACTSDVQVGEQLLARKQGAPGADGGLAESGTRSTSPCVPLACSGSLLDCGDCADNDNDGRVDMRDPDCIGPCDNSEVIFSAPTPGENRAPCVQDCYFDGNTGFGDDGCSWSHTCDPLSIAPDFPPEGAECAYAPNAPIPQQGPPTSCQEAMADQAPLCAEVCGPLVPNGCDCFGCCRVPGAPGAVWLGSTDDQSNPSCDRGSLDDPSRCKPCTPVPACTNPCEECELCFGKNELPAHCRRSGEASECPEPECTRGEPCGTPCLPPCPAGQVCVTGCCATIPA